MSECEVPPVLMVAYVAVSGAEAVGGSVCGPVTERTHVCGTVVVAPVE
jgi:hypothetical protein